MDGDSQVQPAAAASLDIDAIDVTGNTILSQDAIERAIYPHLGPGKSADDVEAARAALQKAYHDQGYQSVSVDIPDQSLDSRVFTLLVNEQRVAKLAVTGVKGGAAEAVAAAIPALKAGEVPNLRDAQRQIDAANRFPERQILPAIVPGEQPGTIDVELAVESKSAWHGTLELTNDHNQGTRPLRASATARHSNLWGLGHQLSVTALLAPQDTDNLQVLSGSYLAPLSSSFSLLVFGYTSNSNIAALGGTNVLGDGYLVGLRGVLNLPAKADNFSHSVNFGFDYKNFNEDIMLTGVDEKVHTPIDYVTFNGSYQATLLTDEVSVNGSVAITAGVPGFGDEAFEGVPVFGNKGGLFNADANFVHLNVGGDITYSYPDDVMIFLRGEGQIASGPLVSNEQFASGGFLSVRGYLQSEGVGDSGFNGSVELRTPSFARWVGEWADEWRIFGFVDSAFVKVRDPGEGVTPEYRLLSTGVGTRFRIFSVLEGDAALGWPLLSSDKSNSPIVTFSVKAEY